MHCNSSRILLLNKEEIALKRFSVALPQIMEISGVLN